MNLLLQREVSSAVSMKSELFLDGGFFCYTLERPEEGNIVAIPAGIYDVELVMSPHFKRLLPHIMNVPGRTAILMHGGNEARDSLGCVLCGYNEEGEDWIGDASAVKDLVRLMQAQGGKAKIQIMG